MQIAESTRRNIADAILVEGVSWSGRLTQPDFLSRVFDLRALPSHDRRFKDAYGDAWQHTVNNTDWEPDWVFHDGRFNLLHTNDEVFLRFLCEMIHPVVRSDAEEVERLRQLLNGHLSNEGLELVEKARMGGRPIYAARQIELTAYGSIEELKDRIRGTDADYIARQITRMEAAVRDDPGLAIGTAKELIETCCKTLLDEHGVAHDELDLPQLVKATCKVLDLAPGDVPDAAKGADTIRRILGNLATIAHGMAELRNTYGTGHGKSANTKGLTSRHARLAVGAASTLSVFLFETNEARRTTGPRQA